MFCFMRQGGGNVKSLIVDPDYFDTLICPLCDGIERYNGQCTCCNGTGVIEKLSLMDEKDQNKGKVK
jgi:hypothetical protein